MPATPQSASSRSASAKAKARKLPKERTQFVELLLANHFGTIPGSALKAKVAPKGNTTYEQLMCVGYNPQFKRLDAVVNIKQSGGYNGGLCTAGSQEYVKFFISTDGGTTWSEKGTVSFNVWDVPGAKPLEYAASLYVDLEEECCKYENLVDVRAILSWQVPPGGPDDPIVWGNALDAKIQVEPIPSDTLLQLLECLEIKFPFDKVSLIADLEQPVKFGTAKGMTALDLHKAYEGTKVPQHRYLFGHAQQLLAEPAQLTKTLSSQKFEPFPGLSELVDISKVIAFILDPQGNETYEELGCVGFNENTTELVATIDVKLPSGYSGSLCTAGSQEFVNFWVDWGSGWQFVGTTSANVHDIASFPAGGLRYSASLPFSQALAHRRPCEKGAVEAKVRAVLSWATPPSTTDPYAVPVWGGHAETRILLPPGYPIVPGGGPHLESIGGMSPGDIGPLGLTLPGKTATSLGFKPNKSPFGGQIWFSGHIFNRFLPAVFGGPGIEYRIWIKANGGGWVAMNTSFTLKT